MPLNEAVCAFAPIAANPANNPTKLTVVKNFLDVIFRSLRADLLPCRPANMKFANLNSAALGDRASVAEQSCAFAPAPSAAGATSDAEAFADVGDANRG